MDAHPSPHPTPETLAAYALGQFDDPLAEAVARHLEDCLECRRRVAEAAPDTFLEGLRAAHASAETPASGEGEPTIDPVAIGDAPVVSDDTQTAAGDTPNGDGLQPGTRIGHFGDYELQRVLGEGGMGIVYKARQLSLNRPVALKMIRAVRFPSPDEVRRFHNEAEAVARLDHPNIVPIFEVGRYDDQHYFSMKLIAGESLDKRLKDYIADPRCAARLVAVTADAIHHAHQRGILHRDLKPANILIDSYGQPHVTDFGLAKRVEGDNELTRSGAIVGTPAYMAPEQASGHNRAITTSTDVYGLGAILYALLTGRAPFGGATVLETLEQVRERPPDPPRKLNSRVLHDLEVICLKAMGKEPAHRYSTAGDLAADLRRFLCGEPILARPVSAFEKGWRWCRRRPVIAALTAAVVVAILGGLIGTGLGLLAALHARQDALDREQDALKAEAREKEQTELAEQRLYDVRMNLIQRYWEAHDDELFRQGLAELLPVSQNGIDRRGFEWFYWQRKISSGHLKLETNANSARANSARKVAFSPDGKRIALAGHGDTVEVCDADSGHKVLTLKGHSDLMCVAYGPDGHQLAFGDIEGTVELWDTGTGKEILSLKGHAIGVSCVAFSPDGRRLASAGGDRTVKLWDTGTGKEILSLKGHADWVSCVAFSPDGRWLASASQDRTVKVWDTESGQETLNFKGHDSAVSRVAFSPEGHRLASTGEDRTVRVWGAETGEEILALDHGDGRVLSMAYSPDGKRIAVVNSDSTVKVCDAETGRETVTLWGYGGPIATVVFSLDGRRLTSVGEGNVTVWDTGTLFLKGHAGFVVSMAFSPDGQRLASASHIRTVKLWNAETGQETLTLKGHDGPVRSVAFSPDGKRLASAGQDRIVKLWDAETGRQTLPLEGHVGSVQSVAFSPNSRQLASAGQDRTVKVWDAETGQESLTLKGHDGPVQSVAFSPDGRRLATGDGEGIVRVWDTETRQLTLALKGHVGVVDSVAFSPDGKRLASAGHDRTVKVWNAETGQETFILKGHFEEVTDVAFSPDGKRIASVSVDQTVRVWDAVTGQETLTLKGHTDSIRSLAFSSDGKRLISASQDGTVRVWDARPLEQKPAKPGPNPRWVWDARPLE